MSTEATTTEALNGSSPPVGRRSRVTWASEIKMRPVVWAWTTDEGEGRVALGSLSVAAGREGSGKSTVAAWMVAQVTRGSLPGNLYGTPRRALYVAVEDSWAQTLAPRLSAAGADLAMVGRFDVVTTTDELGTLSLPLDNKLLEAAIVKYDVALVVLDPLLSLVSEKLDTHMSRSVRQALDPLAQLADRTGCLLLGVAHFNKGASTDPSSLITGSGAFKDVPRSVFGFVRDNDAADGSRVMTQTKNSLGRDELPSLRYVIEDAEVDTPEGIAHVGRLVWKGASDRTAQQILADATTSPEDRDERTDASKWLRDYLEENGGEAKGGDVIAAAKADDIAERTLRRAAARASVKIERQGFAKGSVWSFRPHSGQSGQGPDTGRNGRNGGRNGGSCSVCGDPLDPVLDDTTHPMCDPDGAA